MSVAVAVGFIALAGVRGGDRVVMLIYLDLSLAARRVRCAEDGRAFTRADLHAAVMEGAVERVRPKMMTVRHRRRPCCPSCGTRPAREVMQRIACR